MARPRANIDWKKVDKYLQAHCDGVGIAGILGIDVQTLYRRCNEDNKVGFAEYSAKKKAEGVELLKAKQYQVAMEGDRTMLVWLGKQYAGQSDKSENRITGPIKIIVSYEEGPAEGDPLEI